jgi:hypothetical protein
VDALAEAVVLEIKLHVVFAGRERLGAFPPDALQVDQIPEKHRFAFQQVEPVAAKPAAGRRPSNSRDQVLEPQRLTYRAFEGTPQIWAGLTGANSVLDQLC